MYSYLRVFSKAFHARRRGPMEPDEEDIVLFRVGLADIDLYPELNNGRHLVMMDLGRLHYSFRIGLIKKLREKKWALTAGGMYMRYRRRLTLWQRYSLHTKMLGYDERWFYFQQTFMRKGKVHSMGIAKVTIVSKDGLMAPIEVAKEFGWEKLVLEIPDWVEKWIEADKGSPKL